jgi:hypothetical protein
MLPAAIDLQSLLQAVLGAVVAGVGIVLAFSLSVLGFARGPDLRQHGREVAGALWTALGVIALVIALGGVVYGLSIVVDGGVLG